jgi:NACHT domain
VAREPAITFRGALRILGHYDRPWLDRLDHLLGGVILAAGVIPGIDAVWGWVDQKNEATGLLRRAIDAASNRLTKTGGLARHELVIAAHTTMVLSAFFDTLRDELGETYDKAKFTKAEKVVLGTRKRNLVGEPMVRLLYAAPVPSPSALSGFEENATFVKLWAADTLVRVDAFLQGIGLPSRVEKEPFGVAVATRYRSDYLRLATAVPEFKVWADLVEHSATRTALTRLEDMLSVHAVEPRDLRARLAAVNRAELTRPVINVDIDGYGIDAVFPTVERIFLTPHVRCAVADSTVRIGDEHWWSGVAPRHDLDVVLARHFSTLDSTRLPLLILGHPGAGKSLLMKVLAARLPESMYTVVRVPLRRVDADANISTQIQEELANATHGNVQWPALVDQSADAIRVILLDGLDELLQATTNDRAGYLTDIVEFQRVEAAMGNPVAVVVTSRTLVAERVRVPEGTSVLKLEEFDQDQIHEWLRIWHEVNRGARPVPLQALMAQQELVRHPLLLLMLTLYFADPDAAPMDADLSTVELYARLFETYARREATKQASRVLPEAELVDAVATQLNRLAIAALAMFNRGRQSITEAELAADLVALGEPAPSGKRLLGEFFFIHAPEVTAGETHRGYEFLHATFAEYLVATKVVEVLLDTADSADRRGRFHDPDDELLFALLTHQPLAIQPPLLEFVGGRFKTMDEADRTHVVQTLELLIRGHRHRRPASRYVEYRPLRPDTVRMLAAYSANLVLLRLLVDSLEVDLTTLWPDDRNAWPATVRLWAAGLDIESYRATLAAIDRDEDILMIREVSLRDSGMYAEIDGARLRGDHGTTRRLLYGHAVLNEPPSATMTNPQAWEANMLGSLLGLAMGRSPGWLIDPSDGVPIDAQLKVANVAYRQFGLYCARLSQNDTKRFLRWLMLLPSAGQSPRPLELVELFHPGLLASLAAESGESRKAGWTALLHAATQPKFHQVPLVDYLRMVLPDEWTIPR